MLLSKIAMICKFQFRWLTSCPYHTFCLRDETTSQFFLDQDCTCTKGKWTMPDGGECPHANDLEGYYQWVPYFLLILVSLNQTWPNLHPKLTQRWPKGDPKVTQKINLNWPKVHPTQNWPIVCPKLTHIQSKSKKINPNFKFNPKLTQS